MGFGFDIGCLRRFSKASQSKPAELCCSGFVSFESSSSDLRLFRANFGDLLLLDLIEILEDIGDDAAGELCTDFCAKESLRGVYTGECVECKTVVLTLVFSSTGDAWLLEFFLDGEAWLLELVLDGEA